MALIKVYSYKRDKFVEVELQNVSDINYDLIRKQLASSMQTQKAYRAIADAFVYGIELCPDANPSDIWQHIIYRTYLELGNNEQSWKRASGQGFEEALADIYNPRLLPYRIRLVVLTKVTALKTLKEMKLDQKLEPSKIDIAVEGNCNPAKNDWKIFGIIHAKTSIAERIKDDAPASNIIMTQGFLSIAATLDSKSFPPPHGDAINHGELGGRTIASGLKEDQPKRNYFEKYGDFSNGYSFNLRTPESPIKTLSGSRIKTLSFSERQPDAFVQDIVDFWNNKRDEICKTMPVTEVL